MQLDKSGWKWMEVSLSKCSPWLLLFVFLIQYSSYTGVEMPTHKESESELTNCHTSGWKLLEVDES